MEDIYVSNNLSKRTKRAGEEEEEEWEKGKKRKKKEMVKSETGEREGPLFLNIYVFAPGKTDHPF